MRIIAGKHKGRQLHSFRGKDIRPTSDKVKEAVFNILGTSVIGSRVLDLFSGSGSLGIEALSRGAESIVFIEKNSKALKLINSNVSLLKENKNVEIIAGDVFKSIRKIKNFCFDIVFVDPPYKEQLSSEIFDCLDNSGVLASGALIIYETDAGCEFNEININYELLISRKYGNTKVSFFKYQQAAGEEE